MAESTVKSSIALLGKVLMEEGKYLWGAEGKVEELRDELLWMRSFLREGDALQYKDEIVSTWICQIQNYVYEAEDIIDKFVIKVVSPRQQDGMLSKLKRYSCFFRELYYLRQGASNIDSLTLKISTLSPKLEKYGLMRPLGRNIDEVKKARTDQIQQIMKNAYMEEKKTIGFKKNAEDIINILISTTPKKFHALYGMGGSGKTTLATEVFKDDKIKQHFSGGQAFAYISKQFQVESILQDLFNSLSYESRDDFSKKKKEKDEEKEEKKSTVVKLQELLRKKKCLVILDDVWTKQAWDSLKAAFTPCQGDSGSKVLITTRKADVANYVDKEALQKPDPLTEEESWELLDLTMGRPNRKEDSTSSSNAQDPSHPNDLSEEERQIKKKIFKVYKGLPLAIVVLGGIFRKKQTWSERNVVLQNMSSHLISGYDRGRTCMEIVLQSYNDLAFHLKPCFLHLAHFPEDYEIKTQNLYWMWIAEGLVTRSSDRRAGAKSLEDVANDYLSDLVQACLVEIVEISEGWIKSVRMHDLVRDVCLEEASCNNFVKAIDFRSCPDEQLDNNEYYSENRLLRMAIYFPQDKESIINNIIKDSQSSKAPKHLRSLLLILGSYVDEDDVDDIEVGEKLMRYICSEFGMLRVLVLIGDGFNFIGRLTSQIQNLMHLRYLSLAGCDVDELPSSIGNLRFLEILDVRVERYCQLTIPNTLWKLFRLRHLLLPYLYDIKGSIRLHVDNLFSSERIEKLRVDTLICLETIENLLVKKLRTKDMMGIKKLTRLSINGKVCQEEFEHFSPALKSGRLRSCSLTIDGDVMSNNTQILSSIVCKLELKINGRISVPEGKRFDVQFPRYLEVLTLKECKLEDDPMQTLGSLSYLKTLTLGSSSYKGKKMSCSSQSFPLLTGLELASLSELEEWEADNGSMPKLNALCIRRCRKLNRIPHVLPLSLEVFISSKNSSYTDLDYNWLGDGNAVLLLGKSGLDMARCVELTYSNRYFKIRFDFVARAWIPAKRCIGSCFPFPRRVLQTLLRDLNPKLSKDEDLSEMSDDTLIANIQQAMISSKCLVILMDSNSVRLDYLKDLKRVFGCQRTYKGSKLCIISQSDEPHFAHEWHNWHVWEFQPPTHIRTWDMFGYEYGEKNAGIKWNMSRHCSGNALATHMLMELLKRKENLIGWESKHKELTDPTTLELSRIFTLCYDDLELHLRHCLISLANFPEHAELSTKKLYQMWIVAGFVQPDSHREEEYLEDVALTYLTELVERGMVTVVERGPAKTIKTCQLKFELRDLLLAKAKEYAHVHDQSGQILDLHGSSMTKGSLPTEVGKLRELTYYLSLRGTCVTQIPPSSIETLTNLQTLDLRVLGYTSVIIPDILWELHRLMHLYLPDLILDDNPKLQLSGLSCLRSLVNLHTGKVHLSDLAKLKLLRKISIKKIHAVEELDAVLLNLNLEVSINSQIINDDQNILSRFQNLHKLKIKGTLLVELIPEMFPINLKELTLKHTKLDQDPLPILEKLSELKRLVLEHESFLGTTLTFSASFERRTKLILCSLNKLKMWNISNWQSDNLDIIDCWRAEKNVVRNEEKEKKCLDLSPLKKVFKSVSCCH